MIFKQFYLPCLAHASYLVGDEGTGTAVVIDPQRDIDQYLAFATEHSLRIRHVLLTHLHADFVAGHLELRSRVGAGIYLGATAKAAYAFMPLGEGERIELGQVRLQVLETPGHTRESISILVFDRALSERVPQAVFTGDTLFIGDVGRPDLRAALGWKAADLAGMLYDSLHNKLLPLPDVTLVYPAHGAGSLCGRAISKETVSTLGDQRRLNYALQPMTKDAFIQLITTDQPEAPAYFNYDAVLNSQEHETLDQALAHEMISLSLDTVLELQARGAQVLDTREPAEFAAAHLKGSVNIGLAGQFATWAGTVLDRARPIVLIAAAGHEKESALRLGRIGFDQVAGYLEHGLHALGPRPDLVASTERFSPSFAAELLAGAHSPCNLDVRTPRERSQKFITGSRHIPLNHLTERANEIPRDRPVLIHCAGGYRSSIAASLLQGLGFAGISEIAGGLAAWESAKLPVESPQSEATA
jgi:glyoxylase-like metal-dependent hydrolase (beta-lactamase superfamily II)/rhodanese-related sulfurtransferase